MFESAWKVFVFIIACAIMFIPAQDFYLAVAGALLLVGFVEVFWAAISLLYHIGVWTFFELQKKDQNHE